MSLLERRGRRRGGGREKGGGTKEEEDEERGGARLRRRSLRISFRAVLCKELPSPSRERGSRSEVSMTSTSKKHFFLGSYALQRDESRFCLRTAGLSLCLARRRVSSNC